MVQDTDHTQAIRLENLSPTWVKKLDEQYGRAKAENGGYVEFHLKFEGGKPRPGWYQMVLSFQPYLDKLLNKKKQQ